MSEKKKQIRANFRESVFIRDGYKCVFCDITTNLDAHHITDRNLLPNGGYVCSNGITLCHNHHDLVEDWHRFGEVTEEKYHPDNLYAMIGSSYQQAYNDSLKLGKITC